MKLNTIMSWPTFKKKFNPKMCVCHDGVLPIAYSISPTLVNCGFQFIGNFTEHELPKKPKDIAIDIYEDFMVYHDVQPTDLIVVYFVHNGSRINSMPRSVEVYMGPPKNAKNESEVTA